MPDDTRLFRFGRFELDCASRELRKDGVRLKLEEQPFRLLAELVARQGDVLTREDLKKTLWPDDTYVDFDRGLTRVMNKIRIALGDSAVNPRFIETLPRRGYRFTAPVSIMERTAVRHDPSETEANRLDSPSKTTKAFVVGRWWSVIALFAAVIVTALVWVGPMRTPARITALAVLPLENVAPGPNGDDFADGMTDQLIASLSRINSLRVVSYKSVMRYKGAGKKSADIAKELQVGGLVEGSLLTSGGRVRINVRLIRVPSEQAVWTRTYERDAVDSIDLQSEVAQNIAEEIGAVVTPDDRKRLARQARSLAGC